MAAAAAQAAAVAQAAQAASFAQAQHVADHAALEGVRDSVLRSFEAEDAASEVVELVLRQATDCMIGNHLDRLAIPYTVRCVIKEALDFVKCAFIGQDTGAIHSEYWHVDPYAPRVAVDPWARAAIEVQGSSMRRALSPTDAHANTQAALSATAPRRAAAHAKRPAAAPSSVGSKSLDKLASTTRSLTSPTGIPNKPSMSTSLDGANSSSVDRGSDKKKRDGADKGKPNAPAALSSPDALTSQTPATMEEQLFVNRARAEERRRAEARALSDKLNRQLEDVKKESNFTVDGAGRVIQIASFDGSAGGAGGRRGFATDADRYKITGGAFGAPLDLAPVRAPANRRGNGPASAPAAPLVAVNQSAPVAAGASTGANNSPTRAPARKRKPDAAAFYQEEATHGPMVDMSLAPAGGVSVRGADQTTKGGELKVPKSRMTRAEFQKLASTQQMVPIDDGFDSPAAGRSPPQAGLPPHPPTEAPRHQQRESEEASKAQQQKQRSQIQPLVPRDEFKAQGVAALPVAKRNASPTTDERASQKQAMREQAKKQAAATSQKRGSSKSHMAGNGSLLVDDEFAD
jgi:hypothetical protein